MNLAGSRAFERDRDNAEAFVSTSLTHAAHSTLTMPAPRCASALATAFGYVASTWLDACASEPIGRGTTAVAGSHPYRAARRTLWVASGDGVRVGRGRLTGRDRKSYASDRLRAAACDCLWLDVSPWRT